MSDTPKVLLHNDDTTHLATRLAVVASAVEILQCNSFQALAERVQADRPDVVYSVRFDVSQPFPREVLFAQGGPAWVANGGVGIDHYGRWDPQRTTVTNAAGVASDMIAEYIFGGFLHFTLDVPGLQTDKAARHWQSTRKVRPLKGQTLLIVGLGHTGRAIAARAKVFGMHVIGTRAHPRPMDNVDEVHGADALHSLFPRADFVAVATPLTAATRGLISARDIAAMKPGVIFGDVSRGGVVDQSALHRALQSGQVGGAVLDVFETEPLPQDNPLWSADNVIISPHCSAVYDGWAEESFTLFLDNLSRWMKREPLRNVVNPDLGY
jgi:phosphoglycerate dehydrogenase-like enzyme